MGSLPTLIFIMLALLVGSVHLMAQSTAGRSVLKGRVVDDSNEPLAGASVYVKGHLQKGTSYVGSFSSGFGSRIGRDE